jgi:hypothetical protein
MFQAVQPAFQILPDIDGGCCLHSCTCLWLQVMKQIPAGVMPGDMNKIPAVKPAGSFVYSPFT